MFNDALGGSGFAVDVWLSLRSVAVSGSNAPAPLPAVVWVARVAIGASFVIAVLLAYLAVFHRDGGNFIEWDETIKPYSNPLQIVLGMLAAAGIAARGFLARRADLELTKQYASQRRIFETARETLEKCDRDEKPEWSAEQILEQLGEEALQEQAEWLWLRHSRPFEVPN